MTRTSRLSTLFSGSKNAHVRANRKKAESRRLGLENLEGRCVLSSISGVVFDDANGNGSQDGGESPLAGFTVFHETDGNAILNVGEDSAVTGADGSYQFSFPGPSGAWHYGSAIIPAGDATGRWLNTNNNYQELPIYPGETVDGVMNFGFRFVPYAGSFYPVGGESLVNQTTAGQQGTAETYESFDANTVAADSAGNYAVAWLSPQANLQDQVFVRVFNADGTPRTNEILVGTANRSSGQIAQMPVVAMSGDGSRLAVSWNSYSASTATSTPLVRTYNGVTGTPVTAAVVVSPYSTKEAYRATGIAMDGNGDFAVLMTGGTKSKNGSTNYGITQFQRFTNAGTAVGNRIQVVDAALINGTQAIAMDGAGNFVVVYQESSSDSNSGIFAQRYSASGAKAGSLITVVADPAGKRSDNRGASVAMNSSGRFVVAWTGGYLSGDGNGNESETAQVYNAAGQPLGGKVVLGTGAGGLCPGTAIDSAGNVTVAWKVVPYRGSGPFGPDVLAATEVRVRRLNADGSLSDTFVVNTTTEGGQIQPAVAATSSGFIVAWNGRGAGDDAGVFTQRFTTTPPEAPAAPLSLDAGSVDYLFSNDGSKR
ncbi:MAG: hypothetical protein IAF94_04310 [Pirellulaceae bacterium]|nr:hypothetical protein [Pirellulaceae bacterium]